MLAGGLGSEVVQTIPPWGTVHPLHRPSTTRVAHEDYRAQREVCTLGSALMEYDFEIIYRAGVSGHVDGLSRARSTPGSAAALVENNTEWEEFPEAGWLALGQGEGGQKDPWDDAELLQRLKLQEGRGEREQFFWKGSSLSVSRHGEELQVPPPEERKNLVELGHSQLGHFGGGRTLSLLQNDYWWPGMAGEVKRHVGRCVHCDRARGRMQETKQELRSLPLRALGMRWSLGLCRQPA